VQMVQFFATSAVVSLFCESVIVSFAAITLCVASQRVFIIIVYFIINSVQKLLNIPSYFSLPFLRTKNWQRKGIATRLNIMLVCLAWP
jgi:hypothetical protein